MDGLPEFSPNNKIAAHLTFKFIPEYEKCRDVKYPVFVKSAGKNKNLRNIIREIFQYQKKERSMEIFFIFGKGSEEELRLVSHIQYSIPFFEHALEKLKIRILSSAYLERRYTVPQIVFLIYSLMFL